MKNQFTISLLSKITLFSLFCLFSTKSIANSVPEAGVWHNFGSNKLITKVIVTPDSKRKNIAHVIVYQLAHPKPYRLPSFETVKFGNVYTGNFKQGSLKRGVVLKREGNRLKVEWVTKYSSGKILRSTFYLQKKKPSTGGAQKHNTMVVCPKCAVCKHNGPKVIGAAGGVSNGKKCSICKNCKHKNNKPIGAAGKKTNTKKKKIKTGILGRN